MKPISILLLVLACTVFLAAASSAKAWAVAPTLPKVILTLGLYTVGNLIMLFLIRQVGMAVAFSVSAVLQLIAVNAVALLVFGERISAISAAGLILAVVSLAMITLGPLLAS